MIVNKTLASLSDLVAYADVGQGLPSLFDNLPKASSTSYGTVKIGSNIIVNDGVISIPDSAFQNELSLVGNILSVSNGNSVDLSSLQTELDGTISLTGDIAGSATFDSSGNVAISATVADDSHNHIIENIDGLQAALNNKLDTSVHYVDVTKFGAAGDGITDDYPFIFNAINSLPESGGTIYFPIGDYLINSLFDIVGKKNISFVGDNLNSKIIAKGYNGRHFNFTDCDSIIFKNIRLIGDGMNSSNSVGGIRFQLASESNTAYNVFDNVVVEEITNSAIVMDTPIQCNFKNVKTRLVVGHGFDM